MIEVELGDLSEEAVRRLLKDSLKQQRKNSTPTGKRGHTTVCECGPDEEEELSDEEKTAQDDNDAKVAMNRGESQSEMPAVKSADLPRGVKAAKYKKGSKSGNNKQA